MIVSLNLDAGIFYTLDCGYILPTEDIAQGTTLRFESIKSQSSMLQMEKVWRDSDLVGMNFKSGFSTINKHTYILVASAQGLKADSFTTMFRNEHVAVYNFPNRGAMAISTKVSQSIRTFIKEQ